MGLRDTGTTSSWFTKTPSGSDLGTARVGRSEEASIQRSCSLLSPPLTGVSAAKATDLRLGRLEDEYSDSPTKGNRQENRRKELTQGGGNGKRPRLVNGGGEDLGAVVKRRKLMLEKCQWHADRSKSRYQEVVNGHLSLENFSTKRSLENFLKARGGKGILLRDSEEVDKASKQALCSTAGPREINRSETLSECVGPCGRLGESKPFPAPFLGTVVPPLTFIISSALMKQRILFRAIEKLCPQATFIERDFLAHARLSSREHLSNPTWEIESEADLIISPGTGIICTTIQKIRQRAPPGSAPRAGLRERIDHVVARYEHLIILVYESGVVLQGEQAKAIGATNLGENDCEAFAELVGHVSKYGPGEVQFIFVAGGEIEMAKWIVALAIKYGRAIKEPKLLQDETLWELFLRKAGVNAYAAQIVLSELKIPSETRKQGNVGLDAKCDSGLSAFVKMPIFERLKRFERIFGGQKALLKVSATLDRKWR
ncbi:hypothetical protein L228DRAFT_271139 [Xylona heveae TC161]|uniref:Uncharacterized protein n=1 Tax=Xylona heveae (strain CBS 132557 / TC161) TaxID=1328760 RepID=A0A164ZNW1_XYLHT|nr:hypothetical protein L228DRAFT_271139 [Xylona heveae TC161]KZF19323.1 hypothetical protein L228DRAFT_271139 [Xylona heveae TC161]